MHDAAVVRVGQPLGHLAADLDRLDRRNRALLHALAQVGALEQLHREVGHAVGLAEVEGGDDVRVVELARGLGLDEEALLVLGLSSASLSRMMVLSATVRSRFGSSAL